MTPNSGTLTQLLNAFLTVFNGGWSVLQPKAMSLFGILVGIELTLSGLWWAMSGNDAVKSLLQKLLVIGLFLFFIQQWQMLTTTTMQSFARAGAAAAGASDSPGSLDLSDPSAIVSEGLNAIQPLSDKADALTSGTWTALKNLGTLMQLGLAMIGILFSFFLIGIQCFLVYLEFYIVAILSLILLPFGVFRPTAFLAEKAFGAVLAHGIKLMVLAFIIAIAQPVLAQITMPADFSLRDAWCTLLAAMTICFLAWHAPSLAAGLLAGSPSLHAGHVAAPFLEAAGAAAMLNRRNAAAAAAKGSGANGADGLRSDGGALGATVRAASSLKAGAELGAGKAAAAGAGPLGKVVGALGGAAKVAWSPVTEAFNHQAEKGREAARKAHAPPSKSGASSANTDEFSSGDAAGSAASTSGSSSPNLDGASKPEHGLSKGTTADGSTFAATSQDGQPPGQAGDGVTQGAARLRPSERRFDDAATPEVRSASGATLHRDASAPAAATQATRKAADAAPRDVPHEPKE